MIQSGFCNKAAQIEMISTLIQAFCAIVLGNIAYFLLASSLPPVARHQPFHMDLGTLIDFWICVAIYGLIRTARKWK